jgi:hypothetical protein
MLSSPPRGFWTKPRWGGLTTGDLAWRAVAALAAGLAIGAIIANSDTDIGSLYAGFGAAVVGALVGLLAVAVTRHRALADEHELAGAIASEVFQECVRSGFLENRPIKGAMDLRVTFDLPPEVDLDPDELDPAVAMLVKDLDSYIAQVTATHPDLRGREDAVVARVKTYVASRLFLDVMAARKGPAPGDPSGAR